MIRVGLLRISSRVASASSTTAVEELLKHASSQRTPLQTAFRCELENDSTRRKEHTQESVFAQRLAIHVLTLHYYFHPSHV